MADLILIGASTRAAATSARRAGWKPWCADLFADADLRQIATVHKVSAHDYPQGLIDALANAPQAPLMYTGGLENRPDLIAQVDRSLWGNPPDVLTRIRMPEYWTNFLIVNGVRCPRIAVGRETEGDWLLKPRRSAGGIGITDYAGQAFNPRTHFLQQRIEGMPCSAVFVGAELLGVSKQLSKYSPLSPWGRGAGREGAGLWDWLNANGYQYCGNIGPLPLDDDIRDQWLQIGAALARFPLLGLFGVDAVFRDGLVWPIEINPRYPASVELYERSYRMPLLPFHRARFDERTSPRLEVPKRATVWGKAILYARETIAFPRLGPWLGAFEPGVDLDAVGYADIPDAGEVIEAGRPVLTFFASAETVADCEVKLQEMAGILDRQLWG